MSCVNCTTTVEKAMNRHFGDYLKDLQITLLTHKMKCTFDADLVYEKIVTPEMI